MWLILAGRGFGKTRSGAEWVRAQVESGRRRRIALVGETAADARAVMVEGESGLLAIAPAWMRPRYEPSRRRLVWPNGAIASTFSAEDPDQLRGPQFDAAWADELAKWRYPEAWDNLLLALRLGEDPRCVATTTPKPRHFLAALMAEPGTALTRGATDENAANLAPAFLAQITSRYRGTRLGRQEIGGEYLADLPGALWTRAGLEASRALPPPEPPLTVVVGVDPAVTAGGGACETGIVVAARGRDGRAAVLADHSLRAGPDGWARRVVEAWRQHRAARVVVEVNQGGDLVRQVLRTVDAAVPVAPVRARLGKLGRAAPVAALYEQGRVAHAGVFAALEDQMTSFTGGDGEGASDRLDALVWALSDLMLGAGPATSREFLI